MEQYSKTELTFFIAIFVAVIVLTFFVIKPFAATLAVAAVFAVLVYPIHRRIVSRVHSATLSAGITTILTILVVVIPVTVISILLVQEARSVAGMFASGRISSAESLLAPLLALIESSAPGLSIDVGQVSKEVASWLASNLGSAFSGTAHVLLGFFIGLIAFFYFLKDGPRFVKSLINLSPLDDRYDRTILNKLQNTIHSVIQGSLAIALIQGFLTSIGFFIFGLPSPVLWGSIAAIGALIPGIGTALVIAPAVLYLAVVGNIGGAIGLAIWGVLAVGLVDNLLLPKLLGSRARIHPLFILVSVLGGLAFFGPSGFLLGPLVLSLLYGLSDIYTILFKQHIEHAALADIEE